MQHTGIITEITFHKAKRPIDGEGFTITMIVPPQAIQDLEQGMVLNWELATLENTKPTSIPWKPHKEMDV